MKFETIRSTAELLDILEQAKVHYDSGELDTAAAMFSSCLRAAPDQAAIWSQLGSVLRRQKCYLASVAAHRRAVQLDPENSSILLHYANALFDAEEFTEAIEVRRALLNEQPDDQKRLGKLVEALHCNRMQAEAVELIDEAEARFRLDGRLKLQRAVANLARGNWKTGFEQFESRFVLDTFVPDDRVRWTQWCGQDLQGKSLLILNEQGFGDAFFSARFLPELRNRGALLTMVSAAPLRRLFSYSQLADAVRAKVDRHDVFDYYTYAMSLPYRLDVDGTHFPPPVTLTIPDSSKQRARSIVEPFQGAFKVGVTWTGALKNPINAARSFEPDRYLSLANLSGVQLFSLYKGENGSGLAQYGMDGLILDACQTDRDFADTAGVIDAMDLVITTDTAVAHLAASLKKPTWLLLSHRGFWYYGYGETTQWYPDMKLYHQPAHGDWDSVLREVTDDLAQLIG